MTNETRKGYRCKLVAADGAYKYINIPTKLPYIVTPVFRTLRVNLAESVPLDTTATTTRKYEFYSQEGMTLVYREVV